VRRKTAILPHRNSSKNRFYLPKDKCATLRYSLHHRHHVRDSIALRIQLMPVMHLSLPFYQQQEKFLTAVFYDEAFGPSESVKI
jgi:hypothetical protein